jgi:peptidoglycan-associated lipoprotein
MRKRMWIVIALSLLVPGLLLTTSCGKKKVQPDTMTSQEDADAARRAEMERQKRQAEEQRLKEEALKDEAKHQEQMAKEQFGSEDVHFEYDSAVLTSDSQELLQKKAEWLKKNPGARAVIEGHCDERGTNEYNLALGDRRAESAKTFLVTLGISPSRLTTISYGEEKPIDTGKTESAYAKNRRAHFVLK